MPVITLLTGYSLKDAEVAAFKAALLQAISPLQIIDVGHDPVLNNLWQSAYLVASVAGYCPQGAIHIALNNQAHNTRIMLVPHNKAWYIAPDNGILPFAFGSSVTLSGIVIAESAQPLPLLALTPVIIDTINSLDSYNADKSELLSPSPQIPAPILNEHHVDCNILMADNYGNLVLNFTREMFREIIGTRSFRIQIPNQEYFITHVSHHYSDVPPQHYLCKFNKAGYLIIAQNHGRAVNLFQNTYTANRHISYSRFTIEWK